MDESQCDDQNKVRRSAAIDPLLEHFARSIFYKFDALHRYRIDLSKRQLDRLRRSITEDIRACGGLIFPDMKRPEVSQAAQRVAEQCGLQICEKNWYDQSKFDPGRKLFHLEHVNPISCIRKKCEMAKSEDETLGILKTQLRIAWILKEEDDKLTRLGYRYKRDDPEGAYRAANIVLLQFQA